MMHEAQRRYLSYLPAIYQEDVLLADLLQPFEDVLEGFSALLSDIERYFAPATTGPEFLPWLATWVALALDEEWEEPKRRRLIAEAITLYRSRGTVEGLKRYLQIYTGYVPEIREWRWPGGMQIGVSSQIGGPDPGSPDLPVRIPKPRDPANPGGDTYDTRIIHVDSKRDLRDYYVVDTHKEYPGQQGLPELRHVNLYYRTTNFKRVERGTEDGEPFVRLTRPDGTFVKHSPATVTRLDSIAFSLYDLDLEVAIPQADGSTEQEHIDYAYRGDTLLVDELEDQPYRFIVDVRVPEEELKGDQIEKSIDKIRAIVALEKPAHTMYYLKLTSVAKSFELKPLRIEIEGRCEIGVHSSIG